MSKISVELGPVQETLLIPLFGRAEESKKPNGLIKDPKAVEIVEALDYDFSKWKGIKSLIGSAIRTRMFDEEVSAFLSKHPSGTIIEIGAGLNTRYERLDNGSARWFELDLPDSMALRRRFFKDSERRSMISASALDTSWYDQILKTKGPYCFVAEAVIIYFDNEVVEDLCTRLAKHFPGAWLITDTTSTHMVNNQAKHDAMKTLSKMSWFRWKCDNPKALAHYGLKVERSRTFMEADQSIVNSMPWPQRLIFRFLPWVIKKQVQHYHINRFSLVAPESSRANTP